MSADTVSLNAENKAVEELKGIKRSSEDVANEADALKKAKAGAEITESAAETTEAKHANGNAEPVVNGGEHAAPEKIASNGSSVEHAEAKTAANGVEGVHAAENEVTAGDEEDLEDEDDEEDEECEDEDDEDDEDEDDDEEDAAEEEDDDEAAAVDAQES